MFERRDVLAGVAVGVAALAAVTPDAAQANWGKSALKAPFDRRMVVNKPRAYRVMEEAKVDGIIALNPINVFYLSNFVSYRTKMMNPHPSFAVMARDEKQPIGTAVSSSDLWEIASKERDYAELVIPYSAPTNWRDVAAKGDFSVEPTSVAGGRWPISDKTETPWEHDWAAINAAWQGKMAPTPEWALVRLLKEMGLSKGRIAVDDWRIAHILQDLGFNAVTCIPGDNIFRRTRMVKSEVELGFMRQAARANQDAAMAMLQQLKAGATKADIDQLFMIEAAKRGAKATWIAAGTPAGMVEPELKPGQAMLIDAVSQINFYHGDFGRTFVLGEPSEALKKRTAMMKVGWQEAFAALKPGLKYSDVSKIGLEAMKKTGLSELAVGCGPHSVGLQHTDHPFVEGLPYAVSDDIVLEEGMTITVDFPSLSLGLGNAHFEDLVVITKTGAAPLASMGEPLVVG
ncbi:MAG: aminopeptidase P family protein [Rhodospirillaceae bacterium]|nr:aminopeptidase P family protein [Rhodospirillaceae bacterium]